MTTLVIVLSDFDVIDGTTDLLVSSLSHHNDLILGLVTDPMAQELPEGIQTVVSDGELQTQIDTE